MKKLIFIFALACFALASCKSTQTSPQSSETQTETQTETSVKNFEEMDGVLDVSPRGNNLIAVNKYPDGWIIYDTDGKVQLPAGYYTNYFCDIVKFGDVKYIRVSIPDNSEDMSSFHYFQNGVEVKVIDGKDTQTFGYYDGEFFDRISDRDEDFSGCDGELG